MTRKFVEVVKKPTHHNLCDNYGSGGAKFCPCQQYDFLKRISLSTDDLDSMERGTADYQRNVKL